MHGGGSLRLNVPVAWRRRIVDRHRAKAKGRRPAAAEAVWASPDLPPDDECPNSDHDRNFDPAESHYHIILGERPAAYESLSLGGIPDGKDRRGF